MPKVYVVIGEHFNVPGTVIRAYATKAGATREAVRLVNIMLTDSHSVHVASEKDWEDHLSNLQDEHGARDCDVAIYELEVEHTTAR